MRKIKKDEKKALVFYIRYNEDFEKNEVIVINRWYWSGMKKLTQMAKHITEFVGTTIKAEEVSPCVYLTDLTSENVKKLLEDHGLNEDRSLSSIRIDF